MVRWIDSLSAWDGTPPAVLVRERASRDEREAILRRMSAKALRLAEHRVNVLQGDGWPVVSVPLGAGLYLSAAHCNEFAAFAAAPVPIGVQIEVAERDSHVPWELLHPIEAAALEPLRALDLTRGFARLWSLKEAYLKAQGYGLERDPTTFVAQIVDEERALITDPDADDRPIHASTIWRGLPQGWAALSVVMLPARRGGGEERRVSRRSPGEGLRRKDDYVAMTG